MKGKRTNGTANRKATAAVVAGFTIASMLASGAVAQARLPTPESGTSSVAVQAPAGFPDAPAGAARHLATMRGYERVQVKPATNHDSISSTAVVITLAGLAGVALAIPATRVYRRQHGDVANA
jgi:hypothetical protein